MYWSILWKNRRRQGMTTEAAESKEAAAKQAKSKIEAKFYWQGPVTIQDVQPVLTRGKP